MLDFGFVDSIKLLLLFILGIGGLISLCILIFTSSRKKGKRLSKESIYKLSIYYAIILLIDSIIIGVCTGSITFIPVLIKTSLLYFGVIVGLLYIFVVY